MSFPYIPNHGNSVKKVKLRTKFAKRGETGITYILPYITKITKQYNIQNTVRVHYLPVKKHFVVEFRILFSSRLFANKSIYTRVLMVKKLLGSKGTVNLKHVLVL